MLRQLTSHDNYLLGTTRGIQGRINDVSLILASHAAFDDSGAITMDAKMALEDVARMLRTLHQLYWSTVVKRYNTLYSPEGESLLISQLHFSCFSYQIWGFECILIL